MKRRADELLQSVEAWDAIGRRDEEPMKRTEFEPNTDFTCTPCGPLELRMRLGTMSQYLVPLYDGGGL